MKESTRKLIMWIGLGVAILCTLLAIIFALNKYNMAVVKVNETQITAFNDNSNNTIKYGKNILIVNPNSEKSKALISTVENGFGEYIKEDTVLGGIRNLFKSEYSKYRVTDVVLVEIDTLDQGVKKKNLEKSIIKVQENHDGHVDDAVIEYTEKALSFDKKEKTKYEVRTINKDKGVVFDMFDATFYLLLCLLIISIGGIIVFLCKKLAKNFKETPGYIAKFFILLGAILAVCLVAFLISRGNDVSTALMEKHEVSLFASKLIGAACIMVYILVAVATLSIIVTTALKSLKK